MLYSLYRFLFLRSTHQKVPLGRWGYHWETEECLRRGLVDEIIE